MWEGVGEGRSETEKVFLGGKCMEVKKGMGKGCVEGGRRVRKKWSEKSCKITS